MADKRFHTFDDLPEWAKSRVKRFRPNDASNWIFEPVPALGNQSFIEVMNQGDEGLDRIKRYLNDLMGKFFSDG